MAFSISLEQELARWNEVIQNHPSDPKAYIRRGMANFKLALVNSSIQEFDQADQARPSLSVNWMTQPPTYITYS
jgi:hypothetical protein